MQVAFYASGDPVHDRVIGAMYEGCPETKTVIDGFEYQPADVAVVFGVYKKKVPISFPRGRVIDRQKAAGKPVLVLETGYVNRGDGEDNYYAAGFNGLNGRADFRNRGMGRDRADKLGIVLQPKKVGDLIILCGQVPQDASVDHIDIMKWLHVARNEIKARTQREIVFRPHPKGKVPPINGCDFSKRPFIEDLQRAHSVVTFNSNSAVEAVIEGVPAFSFDEGSMAWDVTSHSFDDIENPPLPDRDQWLNDLAYTQWKPSEMKSGEAWAHLFR